MEESAHTHITLTDIQRSEIGEFILQNHVHGKMICSHRKEAAGRMNTSVCIVRHLHSLQISQDEQGLARDLESKMKGKKGRTIIDINKELAMDVPLHRRTTQRAYVAALGVSITKMHKWIKEGQILSYSNAINPQISCINEMNRLFYSLSHLKHGIIDRKTMFWTCSTLCTYMRNDFTLQAWPRGTIFFRRKKSLIELFKIRDISKTNHVLMCSMQTSLNSEGEVLFDGEIGIWSFITKESANNTSINRPAGTIVTKPIPSIDREVIKKFMLEKLVPAIKRKWPLLASTNIKIRQDNGRPHICDDDPYFRRVASADGFNIRLGFQPPNSPYLNILDLRFFRSIQSLQHKMNSRTLDELVEAIKCFHTAAAKNTKHGVLITAVCDGGNNEMQGV